MPGPVPKPSDQRRRRNKTETPIRKGTARGVEQVPAPQAHWHPVARDWYLALSKSGQSDYYEASDYAQAQYVAELMHKSLQDEAPAAFATAALSAMTELLVTEGARRRARLELEKAAPTPEDPKVAIMADYRAAAGGK